MTQNALYFHLFCAIQNQFSLIFLLEYKRHHNDHIHGNMAFIQQEYTEQTEHDRAEHGLLVQEMEGSPLS